VRLAVAGVLALALVAHAVRAWHRLEASALVRAVQAEMTAIGNARAPGITLRVSELALERAQELDRAAVEPLAFEGDLLLVTGRLADADRAYQRAAAHELRPEVLFHWGLSLWRQGRVDEAVVQLRRGAALAPMRLEEQVPAGARPLVERAPLLPIPPLVPPAAPAAAKP
jgi:tetratricopeptide (TPR) repeat protein